MQVSFLLHVLHSNSVVRNPLTSAAEQNLRSLSLCNFLHLVSLLSRKPKQSLQYCVLRRSEYVGLEVFAAV